MVLAQSQQGQIQEGSREKRREVLVQSQVRFNRVREKVWEALVRSQVKFIRVPEKIPPGLGAKPGQIH